MTQNKLTRSISIEAWCQLAREGAAPSVTILLEGSSMQPLIRRDQDPVTIVPLRRSPKIGDVVLFTTGDDRFVVHRIWKMKPGQVRTFGDNCWYPDPWIPDTCVLGQAICYSRNGRKIRLDTLAARNWGRFWMALHPIRRCNKKLRSLAGRCYRNVFPRRSTGGGEND